MRYKSLNHLVNWFVQNTAAMYCSEKHNSLFCFGFVRNHFHWWSKHKLSNWQYYVYTLSSSILTSCLLNCLNIFERLNQSGIYYINCNYIRTCLAVLYLSHCLWTINMVIDTLKMISDIRKRLQEAALQEMRTVWSFKMVVTCRGIFMNILQTLQCYYQF